MNLFELLLEYGTLVCFIDCAGVQPPAPCVTSRQSCADFALHDFRPLQASAPNRQSQAWCAQLHIRLERLPAWLPTAVIVVAAAAVPLVCPAARRIALRRAAYITGACGVPLGRRVNPYTTGVGTLGGIVHRQEQEPGRSRDVNHGVITQKHTVMGFPPFPARCCSAQSVDEPHSLARLGRCGAASLAGSQPANSAAAPRIDAGPNTRPIHGCVNP
jgi:hypothetical protein